MKTLIRISLQALLLVTVLSGMARANEIVNKTEKNVSSVEAIPAAESFTVGGGGSLCKDTGVSITLDGSEFGEDYYLKKGGVIDTDTRKKGTGLALSWDGITVTGWYKVSKGLSPGVEQTDSTEVTTGPQLAKPDVDDELYFEGDGKILTNQVLTITQRGSETYKWYDLDGVEIGTGLTYTVNDFADSDPVTVMAKAISGACESNFEIVKAYVSPAANLREVTVGNQVYLKSDSTPASGVKWYWQGTNPEGTDKSIDAATYDFRVTENRTYYLRAFDTASKLWSHISWNHQVNQAVSDVTPGTYSDPVAMAYETKPAAYADGTNYNLVRAYDVMQAGMTDVNIKSVSADPNNVALSIQYADGLGRGLQVVSRKASPDEKDVVQAMVYDDFGRQALQYLPFESTGTDGTFKTDPFGQQKTFYDSNFANDTVVHYSKTIFEPSPLNRARLALAPGDAWGGQAVGVKAQQDFNTADDSVRIWYLDSSEVPESQDLDEYKAGTLAVSITTDEEGHQTRQFTNKLGQVVLKQVQLADSTARGYNGYLNTLYVYDDYGNLRYVAPPKAVDILIGASWSWTPANMDDLVFKYTYDNRGRMVSKKVPGAGPVNMVYDKLDRLVLTQDSVQAAFSTPQWTFTKYDDLGRPAMTGLYNTSLTQANLLDTLDAWDKDWGVKMAAPDTAGVVEGQTISVSAHISGTTKYHAKDSIMILPGFETSESTESDLGGALSNDYTVIFQGYYDATFPLIKGQDVKVLTVNYYDNYEFTSDTFNVVSPGWNASGGALNAVTPAQYEHVRGLATGSRVKVLGTHDQWLTTVMFYDDRGRVIQTQGDNHLGGTDVTSMQYDFSGKVLMSYTEHDNPLDATNGSTDIVKKFTYDDGGRLLHIEQELNDSGTFKRLVTNTYDDLGQLDSLKLGDATTPLETLDYDYNIRGWLTGINTNYANGNGASDDHFFGMTLDYVDDFNKNYRNGNIAGTKWRTPSSLKVKAYGYQYDPVNRLTAGDYRQVEIIGGWSTSESNFSTDYSYDVNGNISTLERWGVVAGTKTLIDSLVYGYISNSNQLSYVKDAKGDMGQGDFRGDNTTTVDFAYDANGNMDQDLTKDINAGDITYNHLNLPVTIEFDNSSSKTITYTYDAAGIKLQKKVNDGGTITTTDYVGGFIYQNNQLTQFGHEEGRVRLSGGSLVYDYYITDHLGNTRMTLTEEESSTLYFASMETEYESFEEQLFLNMDDSRVVHSSANYTIDAGITANEVSKLNGANSSLRAGPAKLMAVSPGDSVHIEVYAYHEGSYTNSGSVSQANLVTAIATAFGGLDGGSTEQQAIYDLWDNNGATALIDGAGNTSNPRAYLNYILFDQDFNYVDAGFTQVNNTADTHQQLTLAKKINGGGFIYVYLSNESADDHDVYFDDLRITHHKGSILQEDHYYPFGMNISALSSTAPLAKPNKYKYNGNEEQLDFNWNIYDFNARLYDAQIGRFGAVDPLAETAKDINPYHFTHNNPIAFNDPTGLTDEIGGQLDWSWMSDGGAEVYGERNDIGEFHNRSSDRHKAGEASDDQLHTFEISKVLAGSSDATSDESIVEQANKFQKVLDAAVKLLRDSGKRDAELELASTGEYSGYVQIKDGANYIWVPRNRVWRSVEPSVEIDNSSGYLGDFNITLEEKKSTLTIYVPTLNKKVGNSAGSFYKSDLISGYGQGRESGPGIALTNSLGGEIAYLIFRNVKTMETFHRLTYAQSKEEFIKKMQKFKRE